MVRNWARMAIVLMLVAGWLVWPGHGPASSLTSAAAQATRSCAVAVTALTIGTGGGRNAGNPAAVYGEPEGTRGQFISLGRGGTLTVQLGGDGVSADSTPSSDLFVYEAGTQAEFVFVEISTDGASWTSIGETGSQASGIDLDGLGFTPGTSYGFVRVTDDPNQGSNSPDTGGADIDAICGTNLANSAPVAGDDAATFAVGEPYTINVLSNDSDLNGQALAVESVTQPTDAAGQVTFTPAGDVTFTPADPNFSGTVTFSYTISDGQGGRATATVTLTITAPSPSASASASESESASASESETPSPSEQPSESASPSGSTSLEPSSSSEPVPSDEPPTSASPSEGESASSEPSGPVELPSQEASRPPRPEEPTATVSPTEIPPTALPPTEIPATGGTVTIFDGADQVGQNGETIGSLNDLLANPDGVPLTIALETPATGGSLTLNPDNSYDYIPDSGFLGADAFAFRVTAPDGQSVVADVTLDVSDQCVDQPVAGGGAGTPAAMDAAVCGDLTATGAGQSIIVAGMSGSAPPTAPGGGQVPPAPQVPRAGTSGGTGPDGGGGAATGGQPATSQTGAPTLPDTGTGTTSSGSAGIVQQGIVLMLAALVALLAVALLIRRWLT